VSQDLDAAKSAVVAADHEWKIAQSRLQEASRQRTETVKAANEAGVGLRPLAELLGVHFTRVQQMVGQVSEPVDPDRASARTGAMLRRAKSPFGIGVWPIRELEDETDGRAWEVLVFGAKQEAVIEVALSGTQLSGFDPTDQALAEVVERWPELNGRPLVSDDLVQELVEAFEATGKPLRLQLPG
jgi:hypothetical protein